MEKLLGAIVKILVVEVLASAQGTGWCLGRELALFGMLYHAAASEVDVESSGSMDSIALRVIFCRAPATVSADDPDALAIFSAPNKT